VRLYVEIVREEVVLDKKGMVVLPKDAREELGLTDGVKSRLTVEGRKVVVTKPLPSEKFIGKMRCCAGEGLPFESDAWRKPTGG